MLIIARRRGSAQRLREEFGEAPALALLGAHVKLLALIDVEKEGRRLGLIEFLAAALGGVDQVGQRRLARATARSSHAAASPARDRSRRIAKCRGSDSTSALIGSVPGLSVRKHHWRLS